MGEPLNDTAHAALPRVVYILGYGRSGSTVLDSILGNHPCAEGVGELYALLRPGWLESQTCACGQPAGQCAFWTEVLHQWTARTTPDGRQAYARGWRRFEIARSSLLDLVWQQRCPKTALRGYLACTRALYQAIAAASGKPVVVDSSKNPARAYAISMIPEVDLRLVHLVRDVRGVAWSQMKTIRRDAGPGAAQDLPGRPAWRTALGWAATNARADWLRRRVGPDRHCFVRYEDFVADPSATLAQIGRAIDLDLTALAESVRSGLPLHIGHTIAGNRLRMAGRVQLRADAEWLHKLSPWNRRICWLLAGWKMRQYGYPRDAASGANIPRPHNQAVATPHV